MQWAVRGGLALVAAVAGYYGVTFTLGKASAARNPALAHRLAPYDGQTTALLATALARPGSSETDRRRATSTARRALRQDPTVVKAVAILGLAAQLRGDTEAARRLFAYAGTLSRRDLTTQLWAIEYAVARGDIGKALDHYDIALRTKPAMAAVLFPILAAASVDSAIRTALIDKLVAGPRWRDDFITHLAASDADPEAIAALLLGLGRGGVPISEAARSQTVNALIDAGRLEAAWRYYITYNRGADRRRSRDPQFVTTPETPSRLDWMAINNGTINASIQRGGTVAGMFSFSTPASAGGSMLQQSQLLPPGSYRLRGRSSGDAQSRRSSYWIVTCIDGRELGRVELGGRGRDGRFSGSFIVPAGCPMQALTLMARPSEVMSPLSGQVEEVRLEPMQ